MASRTTRSGTLRQRRWIEIATASACVGFATISVAAVVLDRSVPPSTIPTAPALGPGPSAAGASQTDAYVPIPALIAGGLSSAFKIQTPTPTTEEPGKDPERSPPQEVALVAAIGQPGNMVAIIREGAAQSAIGVGQRAGSVEVIEVTPGRAMVRHNGQVKELAVGQPMLLVSDIGGGTGVGATSSAIISPESEAASKLNEDGTTTTIAQPSSLQRQRPTNPRGGQPGGPGAPGAGGGNSGPRPAGGNNNNGNQAPASGQAQSPQR